MRTKWALSNQSKVKAELDETQQKLYEAYATILEIKKTATLLDASSKKPDLGPIFVLCNKVLDIEEFLLDKSDSGAW